MNGIQNWIKKNNYILIFSGLSLLSYAALFVSRSLDDNRLTSWQWAFSGVAAWKIFFILVLGIISAYILSKVSVIERWPAVFLFLSSYAVASLFWKEPEVIVDASRYFTQAKHLEVYGIGYFFREWGKGIAAWTDMPAVPFLYGLLFKFFGESRIYIQMLTTFFFAMTAVCTYSIGKALWDEDTGLFGGMLFLGIPYLFVQTPLMLIDVPVMFFMTFSAFAFIKALRHGGFWIIISSFAIVFTFYSKYSTWLMLSVLVVIYMVFIVQHSNRKMQDTGYTPLLSPLAKGGNERGCRASGIMNHASWKRGLAVAGISGIFIGIIFWCKFDVFSEQIRLLMTYQKSGLKRWTESFTSTFLFQVHPFITAASLYSAYAAFKKRDLKYLIVIWLVFLIIALQIKRIRYVIMAFPMLSLTASYGLNRINNRKDIKFISLCVAAFSVVIAVFVYLPFMQQISAVNLKDAGRFLDSLKEPAIEVFTPLPEAQVVNPAVSVPLLDFFTKKTIYYNPDDALISEKGKKKITEEEIRMSPLRFTWEYKNPGYYAGNKDPGRERVIAVISGDNAYSLPEHEKDKLKSYRISRVFDKYEGLFSYRTSVIIYSKD